MCDMYGNNSYFRHAKVRYHVFIDLRKVVVNPKPVLATAQAIGYKLREGEQLKFGGLLLGNVV